MAHYMNRSASFKLQEQDAAAWNIKRLRHLDILQNILIVLITVAVLEFVARFTHQHIMHGWGWGWHKSHHDIEGSTFEKNDLYALVFAIPSILLIYFGWRHSAPLLWIGVGFLAYGVLYFILHDALVHQRWPFRMKPRHAYLKRLVQAHKLHHAVHGKGGCVSFGFLYAPPVEDLKAELKIIHGGTFDAKAAGSRQP
jgi:beta-carotene 3-hydroxylase